MPDLASGAFHARERPSVWRRLGFGECSAPRPASDEEADGWAPSWFIVGVRVRLDWRDRLRVLVSGSLMVETASKTDAVIRRSRSTSAVSVLPPGALRGMRRDGREAVA